MKKIKEVIMVFFVFMIFLANVKASSYDMSVLPENIKSKAGDVVEIEISLKDIEMKEKGINTVEGYITYDEDVVESIEIIDENGWKMIYNNEKNSELYGKFLSIKEDEGIKEEEKIAKIKVKIKEKVRKTKSKIEIKEITSNDGESLIKIGNKEVNIEIEGVEVVKTGDSTLILVVGLISLILVLNVVMSKKRVRE